MKIFCVGRNYVDHAKELNNPLPENPVVFTKPTTALLKDGRAFYKPDFSDHIDYEGELVIRICKNGKNIQEKFAHKYFDKIGFGIDFTARDLQQQLKDKKLPWDIAKGFDGAAVLGDMVDISELGDLTDLKFTTKLNGQVVQQGSSKDMIFSFGKIIEYLSSFFTLQNGDLIYTGTPTGVGKVNIGDKLEGYLGDSLNMTVDIK